MAPMSRSGVRVIDPILTNQVRGYKQAGLVGHHLFPSVDVTQSAGKVIEFGKEDFMLYNARRAAGGATKRIEFGYEGKPFALVQDSLESKVPREFVRDGQVPGIDLGLRASVKCMNALQLTLEYEQAKLATEPTNYSAENSELLAGTSQWSHESSKPVQAIDAARQKIRKTCGLYPNVLVCGPVAYASLKSNAQVIGRFRNTDLITAEMLAALLEIDKVVEGAAVYADQLGVFHDVWGNSAVLAYAPKEPGGVEEPSYGYTYTLTGHPLVEEPYYEDNVKSWMYGVTYERAPVLAGLQAGYLFRNPSSNPAA